MSETEFEKAFREYFTALSNIAFSLVKDEDSAKDIVQQVFIKLWDKKDSLDIQTSLKAYLNRATVNTALNFIKKNKNTQLESDLSSAELTYSEENTNDIDPEILDKKIRAAIDALPTKCAAVFSLSRFSGMSNKEIAEDLEISVKSVEKHIGRALKELRVVLKPLITNLISFLILFFSF